LGGNVVQVEVQLGYDADILPGRLRQRDDRLDAELHALARPDNAGVDGADRLLAVAVRHRGYEAEFDQRRQAVDPFGQAEIVDVGAQVEIAVLDRKAVIYRVRVVVDSEAGYPAVGIDDRARGLLARGEAVADCSGHRERAGPVQRFRKIAGSLPEIEGGGVGRKGDRSDPACTGAADLGDDAHRGHCLVRCIQQELVFGGDFEVLEAARIVRRSRLIEMAPGVPDRKAKIRCNALRQLAADGGFYD
jgi:hypothetical protein